MCTVILAHRVFDEFPWFVAANRDENLDRPAEGPRLRDEREPAVFAPVDLKEGGTWMGVNASGVLAALTNRFGSPRDGSRRSRGDLVFEALRADGARHAIARIANLAPEDFNPFHLVASDGEEAALIWSDGESFRHETLAPGVHIVTERSFDAAENGRATFLEDTIDARLRDGTLTPDDLRQLLRIRRIDDLDATCVQIPSWNYGTRSCIVAGVGNDPIFEWWDGAPCDVPVDDLSIAFRALFDPRAPAE